jgi:hypothetical protein
MTTSRDKRRAALNNREVVKALKRRYKDKYGKEMDNKIAKALVRGMKDE